MRKRRVSWEVAASALVSAYTAVCIATLPRYGIFVDEANAYYRGMNTLIYLRSFLSGDGVIREQTLAILRNLHHPSLFSTLYYLLGTKLSAWMPLLDARHLVIVASSAAGVGILFYLARRLYGSRAGLLSAALLAMMPRFVGYAHVDPKDIPVLSGVAAVVLCAVRLSRRRDAASALWLGAAMGVTAACGLFAFFIVPTALIALAACRPFRTDRRSLRLVAIAAAGAAAMFFLCWPHLWTEPFFWLRSSRFYLGDFWKYKELYLGREWEPRDLPWHYTAIHFLLTTPVAILVPFLVGVVRLSVDAALGRRRDAALIVLSWILVPAGLLSIPGIVRYEGVRHLLLVLPAMAIAAAVGLETIVRTLFDDRLRRTGWIAAVCMVALFVGREFRKHHPYEEVYFNEAAWTMWGERLPFTFRFGPTGTPARAVVDWVNEAAEPGAIIGSRIPEIERYPFRPDLRAQARDGDLVIDLFPFNPRHLERGGEIVYQHRYQGIEAVRVLRFPSEKSSSEKR